MTTKLGTILADFTTNLASALAVGATSATLQSATDDDGVSLPAGRYFFTIDGGNSSKEHIVCTLSGTSITGISSVSRQGVQTSGVVRSHRIGATVSLTDFAHIMYINDLLKGTTKLDASTPLEYDGTASITGSNMLATKAYVDGVAVSGAPNATTSVKGIIELATQAELLSKTATGGTGASLVVTPDIMPSTLLSDYKADTGSANAYAIAPSPAITAYTTGQIFSFKATNANTTTSTLNVNSLGTKTIKKLDGATNLASGDIAAGQIVVVEYDGTNFVMISPTAKSVQFNGSAYPANDGSAITKVQINETLPRGETVNGATTPVPVVLIDDTFQEEFLSGQDAAFGKVTAGNRAALGFKLQGAVTLTTLKVYLRKQGTPTDNVVFTIETDTAGAPSGTPVTNGTANNISGSGLTTSYVLTTVTFGSTVTLAANTQYWLVAKRDSTTSDTNYYQLNGIADANKYASFTGSTYNPTTWSTGAVVPYMQLICATGNSTSVWRCDTDHANYHMRYCAGMVNTDGAISVSASVIFRGSVIGFTGLTPMQLYYAQDTIGTIGLTPGTTEAIVGLAISPTEIVVGMKTEGYQYIGSQSLSNGANTVTNGIQSTWRKCIVVGTSDASGPQGDVVFFKFGKTSGALATGNGSAPSFSAGWSASYSAGVITMSPSGNSTTSSGTAYFFR